MPEKNVTIKDIAEMADVSVATVSRVINNNGRFSPETQKKIKKIIAETGYTTDLAAKGLRTKKAQLIGIVVPDITNPYFSLLVQNLEITFFREGFSCFICNTNESLDLEKKHIKALIAQHVSGIVMVSGVRNHNLMLEDTPVVYIDRPSSMQSSNTVSIVSDNKQGGYLAAQELLNCGCRSIATLLWASSLDSNQVERYKGLQQCIQDSGKKVKTYLIKSPTAKMADAYNAVNKFLEKHKVDGIMATTDTLALAALMALRENNIDVPKQVKLTGYDDTPVAAVAGCGITSVHQNIDEMIKLSTQFLIEKIRYDKDPGQLVYKLPVTLSVRASTGR